MSQAFLSLNVYAYCPISACPKCLKERTRDPVEYDEKRRQSITDFKRKGKKGRISTHLAPEEILGGHLEDDADNVQSDTRTDIYTETRPRFALADHPSLNIPNLENTTLSRDANVTIRRKQKKYKGHAAASALPSVAEDEENDDGLTSRYECRSSAIPASGTPRRLDRYCIGEYLRRADDNATGIDSNSAERYTATPGRNGPGADHKAESQPRGTSISDAIVIPDDEWDPLKDSLMISEEEVTMPDYQISVEDNEYGYIPIRAKDRKAMDKLRSIQLNVRRSLSIVNYHVLSRDGDDRAVGDVQATRHSLEQPDVDDEGDEGDGAAVDLATAAGSFEGASVDEPEVEREDEYDTAAADLRTIEESLMRSCTECAREWQDEDDTAVSDTNTVAESLEKLRVDENLANLSTDNMSAGRAGIDPADGSGRRDGE